MAQWNRCCRRHSRTDSRPSAPAGRRERSLGPSCSSRLAAGHCRPLGTPAPRWPRRCPAAAPAFSRQGRAAFHAVHVRGALPTSTQARGPASAFLGLKTCAVRAARERMGPSVSGPRTRFTSDLKVFTMAASPSGRPRGPRRLPLLLHELVSTAQPCGKQPGSVPDDDSAFRCHVCEEAGAKWMQRARWSDKAQRQPPFQS